MKFRILALVAAAFILAIFAGHRRLNGRASASEPVSAPVFRSAVKFAVSDTIRSIVSKRAADAARRNAPFKYRETESPRSFSSIRVEGGNGEAAPAILSGTQMPSPSLSFDGLSNYDNIAAFGLVFLPPDMTGDVGPDHYVQVVNSLARIFDKNGGSVTPPFKLADIFSPLGTGCSTSFAGEAIVLYDPLAGRWLISQYCNNFPPFRQMIAVSRTGDPTGAYFLYEFVMPNVKLNDFAKFGVWPDAYYMSTEEFLGSDYVGVGAFAFDRAKILAGDPTAGYIYFNKPSVSVNRRSSMVPADLDGIRPPPTGAPNIFASYTADEYGDAQDAVTLYDFHADFGNPASSTFAERSDSPLAVASFDPTSPDGRADISQPAPGEKLDSNSDRPNYRLAYRNLGSEESLVFNQTVRTTPVSEAYRAGVRVYEIRRSGTAPFHITEHSTIGDSGSSRWIGAAAQDHQGNIAVGYNRVTDLTEPSVLFTGRLAGEPAGTFRTEAELVEGTGVQRAFGFRWGDYAGMSVDPVDDCTFWITGEYFTQESEEFSEFTWLTRIGRFKFAECTAAPRSTITATVTDASTSMPIEGAMLRASAFSRRSNASGNSGAMSVLPGNYDLMASARGYGSYSENVTVADTQVLHRNIALQPVPLIEIGETHLNAESCATNNAPDPGETVTITIGLRNTGRSSAQNVTATLLATGGITNPGAPQSYGTLPAGGPVVERPFTFTVATSVACGSTINATFEVRDGSNLIGTVILELRAGTPKIVLSQKFDRQSGPSLPMRWTSSGSGAQMPWSVSRSRSTTPYKAVFSPDPNQVGVNELVSPVFRIETAAAELTFQNWYELETTFLRNRLYDGSVLEIKIGNNDWQDILAAGGAFRSGGYDGTIDTCCQNPLGGRLGWSGRSGVYEQSVFITTSVVLPASAAGQRVQLRWRVGTDVGTFREGQYIDDLTVSDGYTCGCAM